MRIGTASGNIGASSAPIIPPTSVDNNELAAAYAPIIHGRQSVAGSDDWPQTDRPLARLAEIERFADGSAKIDYSVLFANEDGGTATLDLLRNWGRTTDYERLYSLRIDPTGHVVAGTELLQSAGHKWVGYQGARAGGHAVLRVSTTNNMVAAGAGRSALIADVPLGVRERTPDMPNYDAIDTMNDVLGSWQAMAEEMRREGKVLPFPTAPGAGETRMQDPQRYVYVAGVPAAGTILDITSVDGATVSLRLPARSGIPDGRSMAVTLPGSLLGSDVRDIVVRAHPNDATTLRSATVLSADDSPRVFDPRD